MAKVVQVLLFILVFFACGKFAADGITAYWPAVKQQWFGLQPLYSVDDNAIKLSRFRPIGWRDLLPDNEKQQLIRYQTPSSEDLSGQVLRSIQASTDDEYQAALYSTNVVNDFVGNAVSISGFIVPIDVNEDRKVKNFFVVPYFGACLHFPPPPPNQMLFVQLPDGFMQGSIEQAYTLAGTLQQGLFEDPLGTSAYILEVQGIWSYSGEPDDFRSH